MKEGSGKSFHGMKSKKDFGKERAMEEIKKYDKEKDIIAYNGVIVVSCFKERNEMHTEFDEIIEAWKKQRDDKRKEHWDKIRKRKDIFRLFKRKKVA